LDNTVAADILRGKIFLRHCNGGSSVRTLIGSRLNL
jgi:hypothetical protein